MAGIAFINTLDGQDAVEPGTYIATESSGEYLYSILFLNLSCSKDVSKVSVIKEKDLNLQVLEAYEEGLEALNGGDVLFAAQKFNEAEMLFPQSEWAPRSALMAAYAYYIQDYYGESISQSAGMILTQSN